MDTTATPKVEAVGVEEFVAVAQVAAVVAAVAGSSSRSGGGSSSRKNVRSLQWLYMPGVRLRAYVGCLVCGCLVCGCMYMSGLCCLVCGCLVCGCLPVCGLCLSAVCGCLICGCLLPVAACLRQWLSACLWLSYFLCPSAVLRLCACLCCLSVLVVVVGVPGD